jgi:hypothetical protein
MSLLSLVRRLSERLDFRRHLFAFLFFAVISQDDRRALNGPIFNAETRYSLEVWKIARNQKRVMTQSDRTNSEVHRANSNSLPLQGGEYCRGPMVVRQDIAGAVFLKQPLKPTVRVDLFAWVACDRDLCEPTSHLFFETDDRDTNPLIIRNCHKPSRQVLETFAAPSV